jgi:NAD(P)-dependent dehydrogenase (short-subunit alcohol dehydrogenase family)
MSGSASQVALVTGASTGIGRAIAERLARGGIEALHNPVTREATVFPLLRTRFPRSWFERGLRSSFHLDDEAF